jgi:hypothetical protein
MSLFFSTVSVYIYQISMKDRDSLKSLMKNVTVRSWASFMQPNQFSMPKPSKLYERSVANLVYFQANYFAVVLVFMLFVMVSRPWTILAVLVLAGLGFYLFSVRVSPIVIKRRAVTRKELRLSFGVFALLLLLVFGGTSALMGLALSAGIILMHAMFRKRSLQVKGSTFVDMVRGGSNTPAGEFVNSINAWDSGMSSQPAPTNDASYNQGFDQGYSQNFPPMGHQQGQHQGGMGMQQRQGQHQGVHQGHGGMQQQQQQPQQMYNTQGGMQQQQGQPQQQQQGGNSDFRNNMRRQFRQNMKKKYHKDN